jgi:DNA repair protein RecO (recombination protein O)
MKQHEISGIVLQCKDMFEKDKVVNLFTEEKGKIKCLAKYANTKSFKFGGKLEPGNIIHCQLYRGKSFDILTQCDLKKSYPGIRTSYNKISLLMYIFETIHLSTSYEQQNIPLFNLLNSCLQKLNKSDCVPATIQHQFESQFLKAEGLLSTETELDNHPQFKKIFSDYTGKHCRSPQYLTQKS